jgi:hypothetical protein
VEKCGGAAVNPQKTPRGASFQSISAKRTKMKMATRELEMMQRQLISEARMFAVFAARRKGIKRRSVLGTRT